MHMDLAEFQRGFGYLIDLVYIHVCYNKVRLYNICVIHPQRLSFGVRRHFSSASVGSTRRKRYSSSFWFEFHSAMIVCCVNLTHYSGLFPVMCCSYGLAIDHKVMGLIPWCDHWVLMKKEQKEKRKKKKNTCVPMFWCRLKYATWSGLIHSPALRHLALLLWGFQMLNLISKSLT